MEPEEQKPVVQPIFHGGLSPSVVSEVDLLTVLNIDPRVLTELRLHKGFPVIRLNVKTRVYLIKDILAWLEKHRETG